MLNYSKEYRILSLELADRSELVIAMESIVAIILTIIALGGNVLVCAAVYKKRSLRTRQNVYIVNLAISDIVVGIFVVPLSLGVLITGRWPYSTTLCKMEAFIARVVNFVSLETMTLIAVHRYFKVVRPEIYHKFFKKSSVAASVVISWIFALAIQTQLALKWDFVFHPGKIICSYLKKGKQFSATLVIEAVLTQLPLFIIAFCYYKVQKKVSVHKTKSFKNNQTVNKAKVASEIKVNHLLFAVVFSFVLCWIIPVNTVDVIGTTFFGQFSLPQMVYLTYVFLLGLASCINPVLYNAFSRDFRAEFKRIVACGQVRRSRRVTHVSQLKVSVISQANFIGTGKTLGLDLGTAFSGTAWETRDTVQR